MHALLASFRPLITAAGGGGWQNVFSVELRFEKDGAPVAPGMVRHVRRKDGSSALRAMAKLFHGIHVNAK